MPTTSDNPDDIHAIVFHTEFIQPNPLHLINQGTEKLQILHHPPSQSGENARGLAAVPGMYGEQLCYKCIQCPQHQGLLGLCSSRLTCAAAPRGGGCFMKADLAKLAAKMLRTPKCSRCRNHGFLVAVKGHAGNCRWKQCTCDKCCLITERQKIMAAQKMLRKQASDEDQELAPRAEAAAPASSLRPLPPPASSGDLEPGPEDRAATCLQERPPHGPSPGPSAFQPVLAGGSHTGAGEQAAVAIPSFVGPQVAAEAAGTGGSGHMEMRRSLRPIPSSSFAFGLSLNIHSDSVVGAEHLERDPSKLYPSCSSMYPYHPFPLGYQDMSPGLGIPLQQGFRHVSYSHYHGGGSVSEPGEDFQPSYPPPPTLLPPPLLPSPPLSPQPQFLPPGFLSAIHFLPPLPPPPPPASFSLAIHSDTDQETTDDQDAEAPCEPSQPSSQEQSN